ncbi:hypothetical protein [Arthrobacter sp. 4R501]|uniref:hypothetical protein n=1 Tax=Arthrobacter sp. 4R501 TaxID=2058886 RepID=UPI000CE4BC39|nr:hypothetical protein [Arthrobacter sp. 4R501]
MTIKLSTEELAQELESRRQQEQAEGQRRADVVTAAQKEWSKEILRTYKETETKLEEDGAAAITAAEKAVSDGDLAGAFIGYTNWHASRWARYHLRSSAQASINRVPEYTGPTPPDLRIADVKFPEWLNSQCERLAQRNGINSYEDAIGPEIPTSYEDAAAWLEASHGK